MAWFKRIPTSTQRSGAKSARRLRLTIRSGPFNPIGKGRAAPRRASATFLLIFFALKFTAVNVILVGLDVGAPFLRQIIQRKNCRYWTDRNAGTAVNALTGIDVQLRHCIERRASIVISAVFRRMDTIHRAHIYTGGILCSDARFGDDVRHWSPPKHEPYQPSKNVSLAAFN